MNDELIKELSRLNKSEKINLVEALWDSIAADPDQLEVPEHHERILKQRLNSFDNDKVTGKPWVEIRDKFLK